MFELKLRPRFAETDALGHINHTSLPAWFELAREPILKLFVPDLNPDNWCLILAKIEVEFKRQLYYGQEVTIQTYIKEVGNSSFKVEHEAWQDGQIGTLELAVLVHFDFEKEKAVRVPDDIRELLSAHMRTAE